MNKLTGTILTLPKMSGNVGAKTINIGGKGDDGATFTPSVSADGIISWTNDKDLPNPAPVNIKGEKGDKGEQGERGMQGIQGIQGERGADGAKGEKGIDGIPATHKWSGTTLYITSASGTSSANLKGDKGDKGDQGEQGLQGATGETGATGNDGVSITKTEINNKGELVITLSDNTVSNLGVVVGAKGDKGDQGEQGIQGIQGIPGEKGEKGDTGAAGKDGANGKTPVRGTDYWTDTDKTDMLNDVLAALPTWNGGSY